MYVGVGPALEIYRIYASVCAQHTLEHTHAHTLTHIAFGGKAWISESVCRVCAATKCCTWGAAVERMQTAGEMVGWVE